MQKWMLYPNATCGESEADLGDLKETIEEAIQD